MPFVVFIWKRIYESTAEFCERPWLVDASSVRLHQPLSLFHACSVYREGELCRLCSAILAARVGFFSQKGSLYIGDEIKGNFKALARKIVPPGFIKVRGLEKHLICFTPEIFL